MKDDTILLERIIRYCDRIEKSIEYYSKDATEPIENEYFQYTCSFLITQIGESVKSLSFELKERYPEIGWRNIVGMRNIISHGYDGMNMEILWNAVVEDVPILKVACENILTDLRSE